MAESGETLFYKLRLGVDAQNVNGSLYLVSRFPLKTVALHHSWKSAFDRLSREDGLSLEEFAASNPRADYSKVKRFLGDLVRKGYLSQEGSDPMAELPPVSVIIPVRNRPKDIAACLESLDRVIYPREKMDVIVVDDASTDDTPEVVARFPAKLISLKDRRQAPSCRNTGAAAAKGEILAFIDSDCLADPLWLKGLVPAFENPEVGVVGGLVDSAMVGNGLDRYEQVKSSLKIASWFKRSDGAERFFYVPSCNLLARRDLFFQLGGFREDFLVGEDVDFCWRAEDQGRLIDYQPVGKVFHRHRNRIKDFCIRRFEYGTSEPLLQQRHDSRVKRFVLLPAPALFWALIFLSFVTGSLISFGLGWLWALANGGVKFIRLRKRRLPIGFMPLLFSVLRSYGAFLYHCCAFVSRYYAIWALFFLPYSPKVSGVIACAHLLTGTTEFFAKRPRLNPFSFLFFFSAEQISYQTGVWWGCLKRGFFAPVNPSLAFRLPNK
jgi:mycofactocin system glycosyltransferase